MPDEDKAQAEEPKTTSPPQSAPAPAPASPAPATQATHKSMCKIKPLQKAKDIQASKPSSTTPNSKKKTTYQWPDDGVFRGIHPDHQGSPLTALLADDKEEFVFHITHDTLITSAIQNADSDPKSITEALKCSDWPLWKAAMDKEIDTLEHASIWSTVTCLANKNIVG